MTPTERLESLAVNQSARQHVERVLTCYEQFLNATAKNPSELLADFHVPATAKTYSSEAGHLGAAMFDLLGSLGQGSTFYRLLVV